MPNGINTPPCNCDIVPVGLESECLGINQAWELLGGVLPPEHECPECPTCPDPRLAVPCPDPPPGPPMPPVSPVAPSALLQAGPLEVSLTLRSVCAVEDPDERPYIWDCKETCP